MRLPNLRRPRALVIDDNEDNRFFLRRVLTRDGFEVVEATTGADGLARLDELLDLAIVDVRLPDMDGLAVTAAIRAHPTARRLPIIQRSSVETDDRSRSAGLDQGADAYLSEPISAELLLATARTVMRSRRDGDRLAAALTVHGGGSWEWDGLDATMVCSAAFAEAHGLDPVAVALEFPAFIELVEPQGRAAWTELAGEPREVFRLTYRPARRPDRWMEAYGRVYLHAGRPQRAVGVTVDVTERERRRLELATVRHLAAELVGATEPDEVLRSGWAALDSLGAPTGLRSITELHELVRRPAGARRPDSAAGDTVDPVVGATLDLLRTALDRATRFQIERRNAEALTAAVVPARLHQPVGYELRATYAPASSADRAGGDFYDAFTTPDGTSVVVLGDVAGHGLPAATVCVALRQMLRLAAHETGPDPAAMLRRLDDMMTANFEESAPMATAIIAACRAASDDAAGAVDLASSGHPPPLLLRDGDAPRLVEVPAAPPLGFGMVRHKASVTRVALEPGDGLLLVTDGLFERRGVDVRATLEGFAKDVATFDVDALPAALLTLPDGVVDATDDDRAALLLRRDTRSEGVR